jgi:pyruvate formate lyase activating enzyme
MALPEEKDAGAPKGRIFSMQRFSIQDGPGIRTTVFVKGCPLRCTWCSNPESQDPDPEVMARQQKCQGCGECVAACSREAAVLVEGRVTIDRARCDLCMDCIEACPTGALEVSGEEITIEEAVHESCQDEPFYKNSDGGVTLSGGEPLYQPEFALHFLKACKDKGLSTAVDTCGHAAWEVLEEILAYTDLVLFDVKHLDPEMHRKGTGVPNDLILSNLGRILESRRVRVWIRIPLIPGYNDSDEHARAVANLLAKTPVEKISLLDYHEWGRPKYGFLGRDYPFDGEVGEDQEKLERWKGILEAEGLSVTIGH